MEFGGRAGLHSGVPCLVTFLITSGGPLPTPHALPITPPVVYLDADTIALQSLDPLFLCDGLCGVMRHSERLNSGVMVLQPDAALFADMMRHIADTPSYTGGDQGFLNAYFAGFAGSPLFDPAKGERLSAMGNHVAVAGQAGPAAGVKMGRLPTEYNADLGLYILNSNRWMVPEVR